MYEGIPPVWNPVSRQNDVHRIGCGYNDAVRLEFPTVLLDGTTRQAVAATLIQETDIVEVRTADALWQAFLRKSVQDALLRGVSPLDLPEHKHWQWERKVRSAISGSIAFGVSVSGEMQGMMLLRTDKFCRLSQQAGREMVYVDYLFTAPWNLPILNPQPRFRGVGNILMDAAIAFSEQHGWDERMGLHALPQAERFYRDVCGMTDLGIDANYEYLRYFELSAVQAAQLRKGGNP